MTMNTRIDRNVLHTHHPLRASLGLAIVTLLLFGLAYSSLGTGLGRVLFPHAARGSLIEHGGKVVGSSLIAQPFAADRYFQPRPSGSNYDPMAMSGSNQARSNPDLRQRIGDVRDAVASREGVTPEGVPGDLVTQSGSGSDPHISPESAYLQIARVSKARAQDAANVAAVVKRHIEGPQFGLLGQSRVNVLELNLALDTLTATSGAK